MRRPSIVVVDHDLRHGSQVGTLSGARLRARSSSLCPRLIGDSQGGVYHTTAPSLYFQSSIPQGASKGAAMSSNLWGVPVHPEIMECPPLEPRSKKSRARRDPMAASRVVSTVARI